MGWHKIEDSNSCHQIRILICYSTTPILHKNEPLCLVHEQYITTLTNNQNRHPHRVNFGCRYKVDFLCLIRLNLGHLQADICVLSSWYSVGGSNTYFQLERLISLTSQKNRAYVGCLSNSIYYCFFYPSRFPSEVYTGINNDRVFTINT